MMTLRIVVDPYPPTSVGEASANNGPAAIAGSVSTVSSNPNPATWA